MSITAEQVAEVLKRVIDPNTGREWLTLMVESE